MADCSTPFLDLHLTLEHQGKTITIQGDGRRLIAYSPVVTSYTALRRTVGSRYSALRLARHSSRFLKENGVSLDLRVGDKSVLQCGAGVPSGLLSVLGLSSLRVRRPGMLLRLAIS